MSINDAVASTIIKFVETHNRTPNTLFLGVMEWEALEEHCKATYGADVRLPDSSEVVDGTHPVTYAGLDVHLTVRATLMQVALV